MNPWSQHRQQLQQLQQQQRQHLQQQLPHHPPPQQSQMRMPPPPRPPQHDPFGDLEAKLATAFDKMHTQTCTRLNRLEIAIGGLAKVAQEALEVGIATRKENKEAFDKMQNVSLQSTRCLLAKTEKLENTVGVPDDSAESDAKHRTTIFGRMLLLERTLCELMEAVSDPDAPRPPDPRESMTSGPPSASTAVAAVDIVDLSPVSPAHDDTNVQTDIPGKINAGSIEAPTAGPRRFSTASRTLYAPSPADRQAPTRFPSFAFQPLAPAKWTPRPYESSDSSNTPSPVAEIPRFSQHKEFSIPVEDGTRSSVIDEEEIIETLGSGIENATPAPSPTMFQIRLPLPRRNILSAPNSSATPSPSRSTTSSMKPSISRPLPRGINHVASASSSNYHPPLDIPNSFPTAIEHPEDHPQLRPRSNSLSSMSSLSSLSTVMSHSSQAYDEHSIPDVRMSLSVNSGNVPKAKRYAGISTSRPTKRRKTAGPELQCTTSTRGKGNKRKSQQTQVITPARSLSNNVTTSTKATKTAKAEGETYKIPHIGTDCLWPAKIMSDNDDDGFRREFVQCDSCEGWYHLGCVGLTTGDPRVESDAEYVCPPCEVSEEIRDQRRSVRYKTAMCLRPDCVRPDKAEEYFVERIIGRRLFDPVYDIEVKGDTTFMWLVKWDGYGVLQATWAADEDLGDCKRIIEEFEHAAEIEGRDLKVHDRTILLNEAKAVGFV